MQQGLRIELSRIALLAAALCLAGFFNGQILITLLIGGSLYMAWTLLKILRLYQWLEQGGAGLPPESSGVWGDISDQLYRLQKRNARAKSRYRSLVKRIRNLTTALDEGLIIINADRCLDWWNPAAAKLLGLRDEDLHQPITNLVRAPTFISYLHNADFSLPIELPAPRHQQRVLQLSAATFARDEIALLVQDVTRMRQLENMRKDFVANISHELRTPLTVLTGYLETLQQTGDLSKLPPSWLKAITQMEEQATRMNLLTADLTTLARLESTPASSPETVMLAALFGPIIDNARALSQGKHQIRCDCDKLVTIKGDSKELHSAFSNLVYNAVKHNPQGCDIAIKIAHTGEAVSVAVSDNGRGIDPKHIPRLTERFYRPDDGRSTQSGGTGLGLAIVKHVLIRHHGKLTIDSEPGKGATFTCQFESA